MSPAPTKPTETMGFHTTRWTVVLAAGAGDGTEMREALASLCATYRYPLYAFIRWHGSGPQDAEDLTQEFFFRFLQRKARARVQPAAGTKVRYFGDYELVEVVGRGGTGVVDRARQTSLNRTVALKLVTAGHLAGDEAARRDHPNIVPIYEIGEHEGDHYFSMKFVEGGSLAERLRKDEGRRPYGPAAASAPTSTTGDSRGNGGRRTPAGSLCESAALIATVSRGVHYAHQRGILHRDLKPGNILFDDLGKPHVSDFGPAKLIENESSVTLSGVVMGTPSHMSPEQAEGRNKELTTASNLHDRSGPMRQLNEDSTR